MARQERENKWTEDEQKEGKRGKVDILKGKMLNRWR